MKNGLKIIPYMVAGLLALQTPGSFAQQGDKYGSDKDACGRNYTIYYEYYKLKNYSEAIPFWQKTIEICPAFSINLWKNGEKMYRQKIEEASSSEQKQVFVDSLLWILDQRNVYFGADLKAGEGYVLGKKGVVLMTYKEGSEKEAYDLLKKSIEIEKINSKPDVLLNFMKATAALFDSGAFESDQVLTDYNFCMQIIGENLARNSSDQIFNTVKDLSETLFIKSGAADCDALISLFAKQLNDHKTDSEWLSKVEYQLKLSGCTEDPFYLNVADAKLNLSQSGEEAHNLAQFLLQRENYTEAKKYLELSLTYGMNDSELAQACYELAYLYYHDLKEFQNARDYARKALEIRPNWGEPYLLIGKIYVDARSTAFDDDFDQNTVLWAAIDQFDKAKKLDPKVSDKAQDLILTYSAYFPLKETLFYHTLKSGDEYRIESWIQEQTTVRSRD